MTRTVLPRSIVRLSAGRLQMSDELQALCFFAGAASIFVGEKLLTTSNPDRGHDTRLLQRLDLHPMSGSSATTQPLEASHCTATGVTA